jgi:hypothetical protein
MKESDFDLLSSGSTPEEAKRLRKLLSEWARGDENAFPVQLALLTRAQWRAAGALPALLNDQRKHWAEEAARIEASIASATKSFAGEMNRQLAALQSEVTRQSTAMKDAAVTMRARLVEADNYAREVRETISKGQVSWDRAKADFEAARQELETERRQWQQANNREVITAVSLFAIAAVLLGLLFGVYIGEKMALKKLTRPPSTNIQVQEHQGVPTTR